MTSISIFNDLFGLCLLSLSYHQSITAFLFLCTYCICYAFSSPLYSLPLNIILSFSRCILYLTKLLKLGKNRKIRNTVHAFIPHTNNRSIIVHPCCHLCIFFPLFLTAPTTLQGKSNLYIPFLVIARPQSQFPHSCVCERLIYSQDRSIYFPAAE